MADGIGREGRLNIKEFFCRLGRGDFLRTPRVRVPPDSKINHIRPLARFLIEKCCEGWDRLSEARDIFETRCSCVRRSVIREAGEPSGLGF